MLRDAGGAEVATGSGPSRLTVENVHRWAPGDGYLYDLEIQLVDGAGELLDSYHQSVGVRPWQWTAHGSSSTASRSTSPASASMRTWRVIGKGHNDAFMAHDFHLLKWIGANSFRPPTTRTPRRSWTTPTARASWSSTRRPPGMNMGLGGGILGQQGYTTFSPETINERTREVHAQAIRELVARDKNHPSVVLWSIANEPESIHRAPSGTSSRSSS